MRSAAVAMTVCAATALAGCSGSARDQIQAKVQQLTQAVSDHDYKSICDQILAPSLVAHLVRNQISCEEAMRVALSSVHDPVISIGKIEVSGRRATVITLTVARGQRASLAALELLDTGQGWRISSLGSLTAGAAAG